MVCLQAFCEAFNAAFPTLYPKLYECEDNPFVDQNRQVDLSGAGQGVRMGPDAPVIFSLPSQLPHGEFDAAGLSG